MGRRILIAFVVVAGVLGRAVPVHAGEPARTLIIGTKQSPPFAMKAPDGTWTGLSIELWREIAVDLGVTYEIRELDLEGLLRAVQDHTIDVAVGALTINADRERLMDFTHPIYSTGLSIAVRPRSGGGLWHMLSALLSWDIAKLLAGLLLLLGASGALVWLAERRANASQFGGGAVHGVGAGLWWSAVTMTTVGYGDKAPVTIVGRVVALGWMFAAIIIFSFFTASITSSLTVQRLESTIKGPADLAGAQITSIAGSTSATYLERRGLAFAPSPNVRAGLEEALAGKADAMVYDAPLLQYTAKTLGGDLLVLPHTFKRQDYGFAVPEGSPLREQINRALLRELASERWQALLEHYLGD